ncbi:MAG: minor capsid protein [Moraxellaceae bacterium]
MSQQQLLDQTIRHAVQLEGLKQSEVNKIAKFLREIEQVLRAKLSIDDDLSAFSRTRLEQILADVGNATGAVFTSFYDDLMLSLGAIAAAEVAFEVNSIGRAAVQPVAPVIAQVQRAVAVNPLSAKGIQGKLLEPFIKDFSKVEKDRLIGAIRQGAFTGQTNAQIIRNIRGTKAANYKDGLLDVTKRNADAIVRTSIQHVSNVARNETWKSNSDIVTGVRIVATLDSRTSATCRSLDGRVFKLSEGVRPPFHIRCRTTTVAVLDPKYAGKDTPQKRASMNGQVDDQTYYEWLKSQPVSFQDSVLGVDRSKLLRDGGLPADRFAALQLDRNFKPITLDEMRRLEPVVFERAGL